jgi:hypothetical protein
MILLSLATTVARFLRAGVMHHTLANSMAITGTAQGCLESEGKSTPMASVKKAVPYAIGRR